MAIAPQVRSAEQRDDKMVRQLLGVAEAQAHTGIHVVGVALPLAHIAVQGGVAAEGYATSSSLVDAVPNEYHARLQASLRLRMSETPDAGLINRALLYDIALGNNPRAQQAIQKRRDPQAYLWCQDIIEELSDQEVSAVLDTIDRAKSTLSNEAEKQSATSLALAGAGIGLYVVQKWRARPLHPDRPYGVARSRHRA